MDGLEMEMWVDAGAISYHSAFYSVDRRLADLDTFNKSVTLCFWEA